jgi:hypothetical protein
MSITSRCAALCGAVLVAATMTAFAATPPNQVSASFLVGKKLWMDGIAPDMKGFGPAVPNVDTIVNFQGSFDAEGQDGNGNNADNWPYAMVGNAPTAGGTTEIDAPVIPVSIRMLDANGRQAYANGHRLYMDATDYVGKVLRSPLFSKTWFSSSSVPTQYTDAVQRAEFWSVMRQDWHTLLAPHVAHPRVMSLPYGSYEYALKGNGHCCQFVVVNENTFVSLLFPSTYPVDDTTVIGAAELAGDMTPKTLATFLFPNTFLYIGTPDVCCVIGFHSFDFEPPAANSNLPRAYVMDYASWVSPGDFTGNSFEDVTAISHELAETFNDPLVLAFSASGGACGSPGQPLCLNTTPWWLSPNGNCQDDLEVGDVVEDLPDASFAMELNGYTFHPQNVALLQYFEQKEDSSALDGAFSYPDESVITQPSVPQQAFCTGPLPGDQH